MKDVHYNGRRAVLNLIMKGMRPEASESAPLTWKRTAKIFWRYSKYLRFECAAHDLGHKKHRERIKDLEKAIDSACDMLFTHEDSDLESMNETIQDARRILE
jgi:hypothetical protein